MSATGLLLAVSAILAVPSMASADPAQPASEEQSAAPASPAQPAANPMQPAVTGQAAAPAAIPGATANPDEIVCKRTAPPTGSRLGGGSVCHTAREWAQREQASQEAIMRQQQEGLTLAPPGK